MVTIILIVMQFTHYFMEFASGEIVIPCYFCTRLTPEKIFTKQFYSVIFIHFFFILEFFMVCLYILFQICINREINLICYRDV